MDVNVVGYRWCKHFQNAITLLANFTPTHIVVPSETPNRTLLFQKVQHVIGKRACINQPAPTSPQIVIIYKNTAICVPGATELKSILQQEDLKTFCVSSMENA